LKTRSIALLGLVAILSPLAAVGCGQQTMGQKPGDEFNSALSPQQKATLEQRKAKQEAQ
jgi:hypothetical protein